MSSESRSIPGKGKIDRSACKRSSLKLQPAAISAFFLDWARRASRGLCCDRSWPPRKCKGIACLAWCSYSHDRDGQIDVRLPPGCYGNLIVNVKRGQSRPKRACGECGVDPDRHDWHGPRSRSRLSSRYVLAVLKWRKNRSIFKARRVFSFDIVQSDSFLCQPADEHNREAFACESDHSRLATIIVDVPVAVENLPVVWMAYNAASAFRCLSIAIAIDRDLPEIPTFAVSSKRSHALCTVGCSFTLLQKTMHRLQIFLWGQLSFSPDPRQSTKSAFHL